MSEQKESKNIGYLTQALAIVAVWFFGYLITKTVIDVIPVLGYMIGATVVILLFF